MLYHVVLTDVFNLIYRVKKSEKEVLDVVNNFVDFINLKVKPYLRKDADLYLLFDPIVKSDMSVSKYFKNSPDRQDILSTYKAKREHDPLVMASAIMIKTYYQHRGEHIKICVNDFLEADDYVEQILKLYEPKTKFALITTDSDWHKYITSNVHIINKDFEKPYTIEDFERKYKVLPTIAFVTLYKAFFGDPGDNIAGAATTKPTKQVKLLYEDIEKWLKHVAKSGEELGPIVHRLKTYSFIDVINKENKTPEEEMWLKLSSGNTKINILSALLNNIRVIKSRCKQVDKHIQWNPDNPKINNLLEETLGRTPKTKRKFKFGNR